MEEEKEKKPAPGKQIWISDGLAEALDNLKHPGQSYDGVILELLMNQPKPVTSETKQPG
jgi:hypothetical protein